jgi:hypothetical protein
LGCRSDVARREWPLVRPRLAIPEPHPQDIRNICEHFFHELEGSFLGVICVHSLHLNPRRNASRLYLATGSERQSEPVLICPQPVATARSAMNVSSVSPIAYELNFPSQRLGKQHPTFDVVFRHSVFEGDDGILVDEFW